MISLPLLKRALSAGLLLFSMTSCATSPLPSGRHGLLDGVMGRAPAASRRTGARDHSGGPGNGLESSRSANEALQVAEKAAKKLHLHWPLRRVEVTSRFGQRSRDFHEGIDLKAQSGTRVFAAQRGRVIYSGSKIRGYGKMIVIKHAFGLATVYAHNSKLLVKSGQEVKLGQLIAMSGSTGRSTGPHLHFEVRHGVLAVDPAKMVQASEVAWRSDPKPFTGLASR